MPSLRHQALLELFRNRATLAPELLRDALHAPVPAFTEVCFESAVLDDAAPAEYRADLVVVLTDGGRPVLAIVVEGQLGAKAEKRLAWPLYLSALRAKLGCPTILLVVAPSRSVARWCSQPIDLGHPGFVLRPLVIGPEVVPIVTDAAQATPELALLSAIAHGHGSQGREIVEAAIAAAVSLDDERARFYADLALGSLPRAVRKALEEMMDSGKYQYQSGFAKKYVAKGKAEGKAEGRAEGKAEGVITVLEARSIGISSEARARILGCTDLATLETWLRRAVTARSEEELFEPPGR